MPSLINSRQSLQQTSPPLSSYTTPSRLSRALSPPASISSYSSPTITPLGTQQKVNVNKVAIEGKAKQNEDSVSIKMYLKMSLTLDSVSPGQTVQLFPEENVKILSSQVHPLDSNSVPYNFDSAVSPLLNRAARALKLPERSKQTFQSTFNLPSEESSTVVDATYTGHILVSNYYISYVLPKSFPVESTPSISRRRTSVTERSQVQFMAAMDMVVPYISRPPRSPYLLSIPTPRCLQNSISLRIFPPTNPNISSSFASLSSTDNDDTGSWDLASEPTVTRSASFRSRSNSYSNNFADDESSDSSTVGFSYGCGIHGTFPSAERIRIRWAKPMRSFDLGDSGDGRRRVGVKDVKGEMTCVIKGKTNNGVLMDVSYKGTCKAVWFAGVATMLGMDVGLVAKNSDVTWADESPNEWQVNGGTGYTGFDVGLNHKLFRQDSLEPNGQPSINVQPSSPNSDLRFPRASGIASRQDSTSSIASSTSSLLRAPLPTQNVAEYSFEGTPADSETASLNGSESLSSIPGSVSNLTSLSQSRMDASRGPEHPITLHLNMNELLPASRNYFIFGISGTILVKPRPKHSRPNGSSTLHSGSEGESDSDDYLSITLPRFTVHAADSESISVVVKNDLPDGAVVEVYRDSGLSSSSLKNRPSQLNKGAMTKSNGDSGLRIVLKSVPFPVSSTDGPTNKSQSEKDKLRPPTRPITPNGSIGSRSSSPISGPMNNRVHRTSLTTLNKLPSGTMVVARPVRDGPLMIPWVHATVTALVPSMSEGLPDSYAVRLSLPAPADMDSEWLEFGLAKPGTSPGSDSADHGRLKIDLVHASVEGVPVRFETTAATAPTSTQELDVIDLGGVKFGEMSSKEWISWIRVRVGGAGGAMVLVDYVVRTDDSLGENAGGKGKRKARDNVPMDIYLPSFSLPVGRLEVVIEDAPAGWKLSSLQTNLHHSTSPTSKRRLLHFSTEELFYPLLSFHIYPDPSRKTLTSWTYFLFLIFAIPLTLLLLTEMHSKARLSASSPGLSSIVDHNWGVHQEPFIVTTTIYEDMTWLRTDSSSTETVPTSSVSSSIRSGHPDNPFITSSSTPSSAVSSIPARFPSSPSASAPHPFSSSSSFSIAETYALIPMRAIKDFQWEDLTPLVNSTTKTLKRTFGPVWKIIELIWWGPA
ncbi:hypothetical protein FB446DRAFT_690876 [Lentinula raphanica]|nr:hypothetical protein FB446DRAFT_690876 [Lentinula raphanica]